ncbi:hypothetical protein C8R47DRAFT_1079505 [Mycena vitilis]|nr:hypothetical protein C8R47DRAFT_1079505 [Mycena vitilis]
MSSRVNGYQSDSIGLMPAAARLLPQLLSINPVDTSNASERSSVYRSRYSGWSSIRNSVIKVYQEEAKATVVSNVGPFVGCPRTGVSREVLPVCQGIGTTQTRPSKAPSTATNSVDGKRKTDLAECNGIRRSKVTHEAHQLSEG